MTDKKGKQDVTSVVKEGEDPIVFCKNYTTYCKLIGIPPNSAVIKSLQDPENSPAEQLIVSGEDETLPQGSIRALMTALLGMAPNMKGGPYKRLKHLRVWKSRIGDEGVSSIAEVLKLGGADIKLLYLEIMEGALGPASGLALGSALTRGGNLSLLTLKLDYNPTFGSEGCINLCHGLRTNTTLKQLHLMYCGIDEQAAMDLANVLSNIRSGIELLNLAGNSLGGRGLQKLCVGLSNNSTCIKLNLADNKIDQLEDDQIGLRALQCCLMRPGSGVTHLNLLYNRIGEVGGHILLPIRDSRTNPNIKKLSELLIDISIPLPLFEQLNLRESGKPKKKKGGKKKK